VSKETYNVSKETHNVYYRSVKSIISPLSPFSRALSPLSLSPLSLPVS